MLAGISQGLLHGTGELFRGLDAPRCDGEHGP
jgi:hypothetical protein